MVNSNQDNLETLMAKSGGSAGIYGYRIDTSEIVLATSVVQLLILSLAIMLTAQIQKKHSAIHSIITENSRQKSSKKPGKMARFTIYSAVLYSILPLILVAIASFRIRDKSTAAIHIQLPLGKKHGLEITQPLQSQTL